MHRPPSNFPRRHHPEPSSSHRHIRRLFWGPGGSFHYTGWSSIQFGYFHPVYTQLGAQERLTFSKFKKGSAHVSASSFSRKIHIQTSRLSIASTTLKILYSKNSTPFDTQNGNVQCFTFCSFFSPCVPMFLSNTFINTFTPFPLITQQPLIQFSH